MSDTNKLLLFSDYLFFTKLVELPISIKSKDIDFFVENELEASSPIGIDFLKWSYLRTGDNLLIFASTSDRLAQSGYTHEEIDQAEYAIPEAGLLAKVAFKDGWNIVKMPKSLNSIFVEKGRWVNFNSTELGEGDSAVQSSVFAKQNDIDAFNFYSYEGHSFGSLSNISITLRGENCDSIKTSFKSKSVFRNLDIREESLLKELRAKALKASIVLYMIGAVPVLAILLGLMQFNIKQKESELAELELKVAQLSPVAKNLQDLSEQINSARNFQQTPLFNALLIAKVDNLRPEGITFSKTSAKSASDMTIQGEATNLTLLNEYVNSLKSEDFINDVEFTSSSKSNGAKFKINIKFKDNNNV